MDTPDPGPFDGGPLGTELTAPELDLLRLRAARYARQERESVRDTPDAVVFERGDGCYAILVTELREIRPLRRLCRIPGASRVVPGVFYYRGEILSAHDLGNFLLRRDLPGTPPWVLVVEVQGERIGLLADNIIDIVAVPAGKLRPPPLTFGETVDCFHGILDGGALLVNPARMISNNKFASAF
jgi:chemotaxis signal transduction protein